MDTATVLSKLLQSGTEKNRAGMARFGIAADNAYGVPMPVIRKLAKEIGTDHSLAIKLWRTGNHEARILAGLIADPAQTDEKLMDTWTADFDSWDVCDQVCSNLYVNLANASQKALQWSASKQEFTKRAGFALMAALAWKGSKLDNAEYIKFFPVIERESTDARNFVRKAVNWALRQIGKRNVELNKAATASALRIQKLTSNTARWIAKDALRELQSEAVQARLHQQTIPKSK